MPVLLVRHGETTWNREGRVQGWAPTPLTERGREQARTLAAHVAAGYDPDRLVTSDLRRASETAALVGEAVGLAPESDRRWRERNWGTLQGLLKPDLREGWPGVLIEEVGSDAVRAAPEAGESPADVRERVLAAYRDLPVEETTVVVTHSRPARFVRGHVRGLDTAASIADLDARNCSLTEIDGSDLVCEDEVGFLPEV